MQSPYAHRLPADIARTTRVRIISLIGPTVIAAGVIWAMLQPYRLTILHPRDQGFWWLVLEPPLLVMLAGLVFIVFVARPLLVDLEAHDAASR
jgi:ABC-type amino acid transport system permease subunit